MDMDLKVFAVVITTLALSSCVQEPYEIDYYECVLNNGMADYKVTPTKVTLSIDRTNGKFGVDGVEHDLTSFEKRLWTTFQEENSYRIEKFEYRFIPKNPRTKPFLTVDSTWRYHTELVPYREFSESGFCEFIKSESF
jgi:hypothetical protein